ncbi:MAG: methyltransferase domain-containing protein [Phycisphaerales bacterium]|nr:methyltransferase domain-containing protein [Phycisphaerales bacterium]
MAFLAAFLRSPAQVSALFPTNPEIGRAMVRGLDLTRAHAVVEFGPGTGAITKTVLEAIGDSTKFFAVELNEQIAKRFTKNFPQVPLFQGDAADVAKYAHEAGAKHLDAVITALPWTTLPKTVRGRILDESVRLLRPGGAFTWVTYRSVKSAGVKEFMGELAERFSRVEPAIAIHQAMVQAHVQRCYR